MWWYHQRTSNWKSTMPNFIINTRCQLCFQSLKFKVQTKFWSKTSGMMRSRMFWEVKSYSLSREYRLTSSPSVQRQFVFLNERLRRSAYGSQASRWSVQKRNEWASRSWECSCQWQCQCPECKKESLQWRTWKSLKKLMKNAHERV